MARRCPRCSFALTPTMQGNIELDHCDRCGGNFLDPGETRQIFGEDAEPSAWVAKNFARSLGASKLRCPAAHGPLEAFELRFAGQQVVVDVCPKCKGLWLDRNEGKELAIIVEAERDAERLAESSAGGVKTYLFQLFTGFPLEVYNPVRRRPWMLYLMLLVILAAFGAELTFGRQFVEHWWLDPGKLAHGDQIWGIVTYGLLHAGIVHLIGNVYFMWVFGDNVEDALGKLGFSAVFFLASIAGGLLHVFTSVGHPIPVLGASGGIAGLLAAYLVLFPRTKLWIVFFFIRFKLSVLWYFGIWIGLQFLYASLGMPGIAWYAHIGGFFCGGLVAWLLRPKKLTKLYE
ncbi:MAG: rhomboid family intramembrane serine protease [Deltaproteobacteria bacterium]|nr:rhomboid family intramembrane serine protease [Deltaproteobacteria bacterium]